MQKNPWPTKYHNFKLKHTNFSFASGSNMAQHDTVPQAHSRISGGRAQALYFLKHSDASNVQTALRSTVLIQGLSSCPCFLTK